MGLLARSIAPGTAIAWLVVSAALAAEVPRVSYNGHSYVRLADVVGELDGRAKLTAGTERARLVVGDRVVVVSRDSPRVTVGGKTVTLAAPAVLDSGAWLVSEDFLTAIVPLVRSQAAPGPAGPPSSVAEGPRASPGQRAAAPSAPPGPEPHEPRLSALRTRSYPTYTRVVVEADAPFGHSIDRRSGEVRARLGGLDVAEPRVEEINDGHVGQVRLESVRGDAMVTVTLLSPGGLRVSTLSDPFRLVLDFQRGAEPQPRRASGEALRHIVLDAGHGGHDSGAKGPTGLMEKDVVLDVARRVARLVQARLGLRVTLSRSDDSFVPLRERTSFANRERADLFISIHANAHRDKGFAGVETYFLSLEATDNAARQVAEQENEVLALEASGPRDKPDALRTILWDLAQSSYLEESSGLAEVVQDSMTASLGIPNRGVKQAGFYVLGGAAMPAVLIEIGFVTNRREERRLRDSRYRDAIARTILAGIGAYKTRYDQRMSAGIDSGARRP